MLRASAQSVETEVDIQGIGGDADSAAQGIEYGSELMRFAEAVATRDEALPQHRQALFDAAGPAVLVDAAGVAANFQRMVRIADSIGIPYDFAASEVSKDIQEELNLKSFASAQHTLAGTNQ